MKKNKTARDGNTRRWWEDKETRDPFRVCKDSKGELETVS